MPELPEVETIRRYLAPVLAGQRIVKTQVLLPRQIAYPAAEDFTARLQDATILHVRRRGKYLLLGLSADLTLIVHLRMTGSLVYEQEAFEPDAHTRVIFLLSSGNALVFRDTRTFGRLYALYPHELAEAKGLAKLGPEPLTPSFTAEALMEQAKRTTIAIKPFLLDQKRVAGLGNIYVDEALFVAGLHPQRRASSLRTEEWQGLKEAIEVVLRAGLADGGTTFRDYRNGSGGQGHHQEHLWVYDREGQPCRRCGTPIQKIVVGGRGTHFCPHCQGEVMP